MGKLRIPQGRRCSVAAELVILMGNAICESKLVERGHQLCKARARSPRGSLKEKVNKRELIKAIRRDGKMAEFFGLPAEIRQEYSSIYLQLGLAEISAGSKWNFVFL